MCDVDRERGRFSVRTLVGAVTVTGARFSVRVEEQGGDAMKLDRGTLGLVMTVAVMLGSVDVEWNGETYSLGAGARRAFGDSAGAATVPRRSRPGGRSL